MSVRPRRRPAHPRSHRIGRQRPAQLLLLVVLLAGGSLAVAATHATPPSEPSPLADPAAVGSGMTIGELEAAPTIDPSDLIGAGAVDATAVDATAAASVTDRRAATVRGTVGSDAVTRPAPSRLVAPVAGSLERPDPVRPHADALSAGEVAAAVAPSRDDVTVVPPTVDPDASDDGDASDAEPLAFETDDGDRIDAERIRHYLDDRGAPLAEHAETFVEAGVEHDVDPRLVVGIAIAESNGGKQLPPGTYNAWGWSGNGPQGLHSWSSWDESIHDFTARLTELYDTDNVDESFAQTYVPPNWRWWLDVVHMVKADI